MSPELNLTIDGPIRLTRAHLAGLMPAALTTMVADMGGTSFDVEVTRGSELVFATTIETAPYTSMVSVMRAFMCTLPADVTIDLAIIGSTGLPATDGRTIDIRANLWWLEQPVEALEDEFGFPVAFFNDLQVCGIGALASRDLELLSGPDLDPDLAVTFNSLVLNHGTDLGVGSFVSLGDQLQLGSSEEGHRLLPVILDDPEEVAMTTYLWARVIQRMTQWGITVPPSPMMLEVGDSMRVLDLFWALSDAGFTQPRQGMIELMSNSSSPIEALVGSAMAEFRSPGSGDPLALRTMRKWVSVLARFAVDAQYRDVPRLVLAGENVNHNLPYLRKWFAADYLRERYPHGSLSATRTVQVCTNRRVVFEGGRILASYLVSR